MAEHPSRLWVVHISKDLEVADRAQREGFICIGWTKLGDLSQYDTRDKMKAAYRRFFPAASDGSVHASYGQVFRFAHEMQIGESVVFPIKGSRCIAVGRITGPYRWAANDKDLVERDYCNVRTVEWQATVERLAFSPSALHSFGSFSSVASADEHLEELQAVLKGQKHTGQSLPPTAIPVDAVSADTEDEPENRAEEADRATEDYLLRKWSRTGQEFEEVVAAVFRAMGYTARCMEGTHDHGVDVIAHKDPLGVVPPIIKVQCKSGTSTAGSPEIQQMRGVLNTGDKGVLVSLGGFSKDAKHVERSSSDLVLIDGQRFVGLFRQFYEQLDPATRHKFPLTSVHVAAE